MSLALRVDSAMRKDVLGITRDVSALGVKFHSADEFSVGERLAVRVFDEGCENLWTVNVGSVVRAEKEVGGPSVAFPFVTAVHLETPLPKRLVPRGAW
jgi:hypothetical protein